MKSYLKLMRVHHCIKNILIFLPLVFSGQLTNTALLVKTIFGFLAFSLISSTVYIINDIHDVENDRLHSTKYKRPLASRTISIKSAWILACVLFIMAAILNYLSCGMNILVWTFIITYFVLNLGYSMGLKNYAIVDIAILVSGFFIRVLYGSAITGIEISKWLYLTVISMSFYLGLGKRRNELSKQSSNTRKVLQFYNLGFLDKNMYMCLALTITFYSLWSVDPITIERLSSTNLVWTVPLVILICMKYSLNIEGNSEGDPIDVVLGDKMLIGLLGIFAIITVGIIYF